MVSSEALISAFKHCKAQVGLLVEGEVFDSTAAEVAAIALADAALLYRRNLCQVGEAELANLLKQKEISFPLAYRLVQILSQPEIQFYDGLKREMSKTTRIFFDLVVFQCGLQERRIYRDTAEAIRGILEKMLSTLPQEEVESRFEIKCTDAAATMLSFGIGKWKEIGRDAAEEIGIGLVEFLLSASPAGASGAPLVRPIVNTAKAIYKALEKSWYQDIWLLKWSAAEVIVNTTENYEQFKALYTEKVAKNPELAFCVSKLLKEIIEHLPLEKSDFRDELVTGRKGGRKGQLSLLSLSQQPGKDFWRTRYVTLLFFEELSFGRNIPVVATGLSSPNSSSSSSSSGQVEGTPPTGEIQRIVLSGSKKNPIVDAALLRYLDSSEERIVKQLAGRILARVSLQGEAESSAITAKIATVVGKMGTFSRLKDDTLSLIRKALPEGKTREDIERELAVIRSIPRSRLDTTIQGRNAQTTIQERPAQSTLQDTSLTEEQLELINDTLIRQETQKEALVRLEAALSAGQWDALLLPL